MNCRLLSTVLPAYLQPVSVLGIATVALPELQLLCRSPQNSLRHQYNLSLDILSHHCTRLHAGKLRISSHLAKQHGSLAADRLEGILQPSWS